MRTPKTISSNEIKTMNKPQSNTILAFFLFGIVSTIILWWLWSDTFIAEFHSDTADTLIWAEAAREAGGLASSTLRYNYFIPFGDSLFLRPLLPLLGVSITTIRCSMTLFLLVFAFAVCRLFRSFHWSWYACGLSAALVLSVASATMKMREIYFGHALYYSLATVFLCFAFSCMQIPTNSSLNSHRPRLTTDFLFAICMAWAASCGKPIVLYVTIPVLGAWMFIRMDDPAPIFRNRDGGTFFSGIAGTIIGFGLFSFVSRHVSPSDYGDFYGQFSHPDQWWEHLEALPRQWIALLSPLNLAGTTFATAEGVFAAFFVAFALVLAIAPVVALVRIRLFPPQERGFVAAHWILTAEILFLWFFGNISDGNWRLCPMALSATIVTACLIRHIAKDSKVFSRRVGICLALFLSCACMLTQIRTMTLPYGKEVWYGSGTLISLLEEIGAEDGYCTDYWFSNAITVLTKTRIRIRQVERRDSEGWRARPYLTDSLWFEPNSCKTRTVFICHPQEERFAPTERLISRFKCVQQDVRNDCYTKFVVLVYDGDCMAKKEK